jgi:hypothetical protein
MVRILQAGSTGPDAQGAVPCRYIGAVAAAPRLRLALSLGTGPECKGGMRRTRQF